MAPLVHILLKDPVCSEFWTEKLKQRLRSTKDSSKDFSAQLQISADHFLRRSRAIDVELLLKALGKQFEEVCWLDSSGVVRKRREQFDWAEGLGFCMDSLTEPSAPSDVQVGIAFLLLWYFWNCSTLLIRLSSSSTD